MEIDKPIDRKETQTRQMSVLWNWMTRLVTHIEVERGILLGDLAALIQKVMLKLTDLQTFASNFDFCIL